MTYSPAEVRALNCLTCALSCCYSADRFAENREGHPCPQERLDHGTKKQVPYRARTVHL